MQPNIIPLEAIQIAKPCRADWNRMTGDEQARFCGSCEKNVYDISQMTRAQAQQLIQEKEGNLCLRLYRRADGTVITSDCPVGSAATPPRPLWFAVAALVSLIGSGLSGCATPEHTIGDIAIVPAVGQQMGAKPPVAPVKVAEHSVTLGRIQAIPSVKRPTEKYPNVTLGVPMMHQPTPKSAPTPQSTSAPLMGKPTMNHVTMGEPMPVTKGEIAPICEKPASDNGS